MRKGAGARSPVGACSLTSSPGWLAAQHRLNARGRRDQLARLRGGEVLARLRLGMVEKGVQIPTRLRRRGLRQIRLDGLELRVKALPGSRAPGRSC
jgi:hypothetical protein